MSKAKDRVREALTAGSNVKERGPPAADGILSVTPDTPDMLEWRSRSALDVVEASSTCLDDDDYGPKPHELYGKFTWKIENFSEISKRELRSNVFDVGNYKWYILVYPQGCDVCNHLSLFLCVADYDKLLPGWSHFAQFTIAVVNKDPKKSKYSDTLHRFCKKEHDWGWKKFMELSKVLDGFTVADTLVIKAQVQVILDKPSRPFRCLDPQYRRELVRVYLTNVENICRRFCEDKRARLAWARDSTSFRQFWGGLGAEQQRKLLTERGDVLLKAVVKQFFNEKEVTSTLVMDALYSGCKQIEEHSRSWFEGKCPADGAPLVAIRSERNTFTLCGDLVDIAERVQQDCLPPPKDDGKALQPNDGLTLRSGQEGDADYRRDSLERDERRLAELGRRTLEVFVVAHVFCDKLEIAYREAEALKRQDQLIAEEVELARLEESKAQARAAAEKEKRAKKKEKLKARKEAEKLRREAEEAERQAREKEHRRQEAERKAKEAERRKLEDAASPPQPHRKARKDERRAAQQAAKARQLQAVQLQLQLQQQQEAAAAPSTARTTAGDSTSGGRCLSAHAEEQLPASESAQQPVPIAVCAGAQAGPSERWEGSDCGGGRDWLPSLSALAAAAVPSSSGVVVAGPGPSGAAAGAGAGAGAREQGGPSSESGSGASASEEQETMDRGDVEAAGSSGDGGDDAAGPYGCREDGAGWGTDGGLGASGRAFGAPLEEEVVYLRAQVVHLQQRLAARDAEVYSLRAQLRELQGPPMEVAAALGAGPGPGTGLGGEEGGLGVSANGRSSNSSSTNMLLGALENGPGAAAAPAETRSGRASGSGDGTSGSGSGGEGGPGTSNGGHALLAHAPGLSAALVAARSSANAATGPGAGGGARGGPAGSLNNGGLGMQRSTSATLPGVAANGSSVAGAMSNAAAFVQLAAAGTNRRPRAQEGAAAGSRSGEDGSGTATAAGTAAPSKGGTTFAAATLSSSRSTAATANGTRGLAHSTAAAAGTKTAAAASGASAAVSGTSMSGSLGPSGANGTHASGEGGKQRPEEGGGSSSGFGGSPRALMQAAQARGLAGFGAATPVSSSSKRTAPTAQMDSPGLEDFAHINMIDDLLTE